MVTHDRVFLRKLATRIIELDRGLLTSWSCDYDTFLVRKQAALEAEAVQRALFDKRLAQEEVWTAARSRPGGPAIRAASARCWPCGRSAASDATGREPSRCSSRRPSYRAGW